MRQLLSRNNHSRYRYMYVRDQKHQPLAPVVRSTTITEHPQHGDNIYDCAATKWIHHFAFCCLLTSSEAAGGGSPAPPRRPRQAAAHTDRRLSSRLTSNNFPILLLPLPPRNLFSSWSLISALMRSRLNNSAAAVGGGGARGRRAR